MKKKSTQTGSISANPTALLLPLDADGFTRLLESIAGESPEDFASKLSGRRIESAHRFAWCEVTEATEGIQPSAEANQANFAEASAQRKLTDILDGLMPAISLRNHKVAAAAEQTAFLRHLKDNADALETEAATLKARDLRDFRGEPPSTDHMEDEIVRLEDYLDHGDWKTSRYDRADAAFKEGMQWWISKGEYTGDPSKEGVMQRIAALKNQIKEVNFKIDDMLDIEEIQRLTELETKLPPLRSEIAATEDKATTIQASADAETVELKVKVEAAAIIARAIILACHIKCGITTAAA